MELGKMFTPGYWPRDKSWIPKNLCDLLYNPRQQNSWFLFASHICIQPAGVSFPLEIERFFQSLPEEPTIKKWFPSSSTLLKEYTSWLDENYGPCGKQRNYFVRGKTPLSTKSFTWEKFLKETGQSIGVSLLTGRRIE
jgi:hypothetical protein